MDLDPNEFPSPFDNAAPASTAKRFVVAFMRRFEVEVECESIEAAQKAAAQIVLQFPANTVRMLSVIPVGYKEPADEAKPEDLSARRNAQLAVRVRELTGQPEPDRSHDNPVYPGGIDDLIA